MSPKDKGEMMARLRARRQAEGWVQVNVWCRTREIAEQVKRYVERINKRRTDGSGGSRND